MLKPIVSMNQMAMNESIATTCCYVWNGTSILGSASLPHGGQLKANSNSASYVQIGNTRYALNGTWWGYTGGHANTEWAAKNVITTSIDSVSGAHDWSVKGEDGGFTTMEDLIAWGDVKKGYCDHKNPETCPYFKVTSFAGTFTHTGATSAHYDMTSGNKWLADHTAVQYSS